MTRKRGRPGLSHIEPSTDVCLKMPASMYDAVYLASRRDRISVPELIRRALFQRLLLDAQARPAEFSNPK